jgi:uncharacterized protein (TIGR02231 family)
MFRALLTTSLIAMAAPAIADTFTVDAPVDTVTIYPGLATVTRLVTLDIPAGQHDIIVPGLPQGLSPQGLRVGATASAQVGAVNLANDRLPVTPDLTKPEILAAQAEVDRLEDILRASAANIAAMRLQVQAAEEQAAFLQSLARSGAVEPLTAAAIADIQALAQMVGSQTLALRQTAFAAEQDALAAERARADDLAALQDAKKALAALTAPEQQGAVLTFTLNAATAGAVTIDISTLEGFATWSPVYDMRLTTGDTASLDIDRAVVVGQATGQDWTDVRLVLSTARPGEQTSPSMVWPQPLRIVSQDDADREREGPFLANRLGDLAQADNMIVMQEAASAPVAMTAAADFSGATVTYTYPTRVNIRNGVDDLRLPLDRLTLDAKVWAEAVPSQDSIAFRMAEFTNTTQELLLPGQALLFADGTMIGFDQMPLLAAGADRKMGFGPLDGLRLTYATPARSEGDIGVFTTSNQITEQVVMSVENLTGQEWPVLMRTAFSYTEQEDLKVDFAARPSFARLNPDDVRGILEWDLVLPAGTKQDVVLDYTITWPDGYILR